MKSRISLSLFVVMLVAWPCTGRSPQTPPLTVFESVVTVPLMRRVSSSGVPFEWTRGSDKGRLYFMADFDLRSSKLQAPQAENIFTKHGLYYICTVTVEPAREQLPFADGAQPAVTPAKPSGELLQTRFVTRDRAYTVFVDLGRRLSPASADPALDLKKLAVAISSEYDRVKER